MAKNKTARGLQLRGGIWHMDKVVRKIRICGSTETSDLAEAEIVLAGCIADVKARTEDGVRPPRIFRQAATKYLVDFGGKRSIGDDADALKELDPYIGDLLVERVHWGSFDKYRDERKHLAVGTINRRIGVASHVLKLCARLWRHENGMSWLETAPLLPSVPGPKRQPYPLDWDEQTLLFSELASHLAEMATFKVNTGTRDDEVCNLRWEWEQKLEGLCSVFVIPAGVVKNVRRHDLRDRVVICNETAQAIVEARRGKHPEFVFTYQPPNLLDGNGKATIVVPPAPMDRMHSSGWKAARRRAASRYEKEIGRECPTGFRRIRVHDLKHTFGRRLRAEGVAFEDRQDLLGHKGVKITTHYCMAEIENLLKCANRVVESRKTHTAKMLRVVNR